MTARLLVITLLLSLPACKSEHPPPTVPDAKNAGQAPTKPAKKARKTKPGKPKSTKFEPHGYVQEAELRDLPGGVVDGDTLKAVGFAESLRLLNVNTEELFHRRAKKAKAMQSWKAYLRDETKGEGFETFGTPMGEKAKEFARQFFKDVDRADGEIKLWLEYQSPKYTHGYFGRHLVYVWAKKDGQWVNYNLEAVRAGMSPYYTKYGYSERYHDRFLAAQREAKKHKRGIWAPGAQSYPDYPERIAWWNRRADQIKKYRDRFDDRQGYVDLASDTAFATLRNRLGRRVVVFGQPESFAERGNPQRIRLSYRYRRDFPVVAFEPVDMRKSGVDPDKEDFIYVEGVVSLYRGDPQLRYDEKSWMRSGTNPPKSEQ